MKNLVAVLAVVLVVGQVTSHPLSKQETLVYDYDALVLSAIPEIANQYAVFGLSCEVTIQSVDEDKLMVQMQQCQVAKENRRLTDINPDNISIKYSADNFYSHNLTKHFMVEFHKDGTIHQYHFDRSDPQWSRNMKIGLGSCFELRKQQFDKDQAQGHAQVGTVVEVMEPTHAGKCISIYDYKLRFATEGSEKDQMNITKVRDSHNCIERPYFAASTHRRFKCDECEADDSHPISSNIIYKYAVEVDKSGDYIITDAVADGIVKVAPLGQDADAISVIHNRTLRIKSRSSGSSQRTDTSRSNWEVETPYSRLENQTIKIRHPQDLNNPTTYEELCEDCIGHEQEARNFIRKTTAILEKHQPSTDDMQEVLDNTILIQRAMLSMSFADFQKVYRDIASSEHAKKLFWDCVAISATNPSIKMIMWATESKALRPDEAVQLLPVVGGHVFNPNTLLADKMLDFCQSSVCQDDDQLAVACYLALGTIIGKTCAGNDYEIPITSQDTCPRGKRARYVKAFERMLENTDDELRTIALLSAVGSIASSESLDVLEPYIRAREDIPTIVQIKAIYALHHLARQHPEQVREPLTAVLFNSGDNLEARTAAFDVLMVSRPSRHLYEKIAMMTRYDDEITLKAYVYQSFQALANATHPCLAVSSSHASHALNLMDEESDTSDWIAFRRIAEGARKYVDADSFLKLVTMGDAGALIPSRFYIQLDNLISNYRSTIASFGIHANNTGYLVETLLGGAALFQDKSLKERIESLGREVENMGLEKLSEKIGYLARNQPQFSAYAHSRFMDFQRTLHKIDKHTLLKLFDQQRERSSHDGPFHVKYDVHKTMMPLDVFLIVPIDIGMDVQVKITTPAHVRMSVDLKVEYNPQGENKNFDIEFKVLSTVAARAGIIAGVLLPDKQELIGAGYHADFVAVPSVAAKAKIELSRKKFLIDCKPIAGSQSSDFETMKFQTRPFTTINPLFQFKRIQECSKTIHNMKPHQHDRELIKDTLTLKVKDEDYWHDQGSGFNYPLENTKLALATLPWATQQWVKREYKLVWKQPQIPHFNFNMDWSYQPASCDANSKVSSFSYVLWRQLFGFADVPIDCEYQSGGGSQYYSSSSEDYSRKYQSSSEENSRKYQSSQEDDYSSKRSTPGDYDYQRGRKSQQSDYADQQEDYDTDFGIFGERKPHGRWSGWKGYQSNRQSSSEDYSTETSTPWSTAGSREDSGSAEEKKRYRSGGSGSLVVDKSKIAQGVAILKVNAEAKLMSSGVRGYKSSLIVKSDRQSLQTTVDLEMVPLGSQSSKKVCIHAVKISHKPPCFFGKSAPDMRRANLTLKSTLAWGQDCTRPEGHIDLKMTARKSSEQLNVQQSERPYYYQRCSKDKASGHYMSQACMWVIEDQARLHQLQATIKYSNISPRLQNCSQQLQDLAIFAYYPYLSHDFHARNQDKQIKVDLKFRYNMPVMDVIVERPQETLQFSQVPFPKFFPSVAVPSIAKSSFQRFIEDKTDGTVTPTCSVTDRYVDTFSNLTYKFHPRQQCEYVVAGDCSPSNMFTISFKNVSQDSRDGKKILMIKFLRNTIVINPSDSRSDILINNEPANAQDGTILILSDKSYGPQLIGYLVKSTPLYKFTMPFNRLGLIFDGVDIKLQTSNQWRHKMCGLCGEYNPADEAPFMGPKKCAYKHGNDFAQSYAFPTSSCPAMKPPKDVACDVDTSYRHVSNDDSCYTERHIVKELRGGKTCISDDQYVLCKESCATEGTKTKNVEFYCMSSSDTRIKSIQQVTRMRSMADSMSIPSLSFDVEVPTRCVPRK